MITATYPKPSAPPMPKFPFLAKGRATGGLYLITAYHASYPNVWCGICLVPPKDGTFKTGEVSTDLSPPNMEYVPEVILRSEY